MKQRKFLRISLIVLIFATSATAIGNSDAVAESADIIVAEDGTGDYISIQNAVTNANSGETIKVLSGTYTESVTITKPITIIGKPDSSVRGPGTDAPVLDGKRESKNAFELKQGVSNVRIAGFEIRNYGNISVENVTRQNARGEGIAAYNASTSQVTIQDNYIHSVGWSGIVFSGKGYRPHDNLTISRNKVENTAFYGIEAGGIHDSQIVNNSVIAGTNTADTIWFIDGNNSDGGIAIWANSRKRSIITQNVTIQNNSISGPFDQAGIEHLINDFQTQGSPAGVSATSQNITISNNELNGIDSTGIAHLTVGTNTDATGVVISNNTVRDGGIGIEIDTDQTSTALPATFEQNMIESNVHGIVVEKNIDPSSISIFHNSILNNIETGVHHKGIGSLDIAYNYWGAVDGPSGDFSGSGNAVSGNLTVAPYYINSSLTTLSPETGNDGNEGGQNTTPGFVDVDARNLAGSGTTDDPYHVTNASEMQAMEDDPDANYILEADIDASGTAEWNKGRGFYPINRFNGTLNGTDNTIDGLTIDRPAEAGGGLVNVMESNGTISDVELTNLQLTGKYNLGGLVGGRNHGTIENVSVDGTVTSSGNNIGGLVAFNQGLISESRVSGEITGAYGVGGIAGDNENGGVIRDSSTVGEVTAKKNNVGGIVGANGGTVRSSIATTTVQGNLTDGFNAGGLVGVNGKTDSVGKIKTSYATGNVAGDTYVGGLVGQNYNGGIEQSYAAGAVEADVVGGLVGRNAGAVTESYWDIDATGQADSAGSATGLDTPQMTGEAAETNMTGFRFGTVWETQPDAYPELIGTDAPATSQVQLSNVQIQPATVDSHAKHNLTVTVSGVSADNQTDKITIKLPESVTVVNVSNARSTDTSNEVVIMSQTNPVELVVNPDGAADTVTFDIEVVIELSASNI